MLFSCNNKPAKLHHLLVATNTGMREHTVENVLEMQKVSRVSFFLDSVCSVYRGITHLIRIACHSLKENTSKFARKTHINYNCKQICKNSLFVYHLSSNNFDIFSLI